MNMQIEMMNGMWKELPKEVIFIIIEFCGMVKCRNGTYMYQISTDDVRYNILQQIPNKVIYTEPFDLPNLINTNLIITNLMICFTPFDDGTHFKIYRKIVIGNEQEYNACIQVFRKFKGKRFISQIIHEYK
jgi:hypothetical protein